MKPQPPSILQATDEAFFKGVLDSTRRVGNIGTWQAHPEIGVTLWSPELYTILRLPQGTGEEPMDRFQSMVIDEDQHLVAQILEGLQTTGSYPPATLRIRGGDQSLRHLVSSGQRAPSRGTDKVTYVGINVDITEEVEQREKLAAAEARAERHAGVIQSLLEHVPIGIAVSVDEEISLLSRFASEMIGVQPDVASKWDAWQVYRRDGETPARKEEQALARAAGGETIRMEEWFIRASDGRLIPVACNAGPVRDEHGAIIGGVVAWYEVSRFKEAEEVERAARLLAEKAVRERETFAATVAHELRTPLSAIAGWTEVLNRNATPAMHVRGVSAISISARSMSRLLDDFLDVSRIGAGKLAMSLRPVDLVAIVDDALATVHPIAEAANVVVQWNPPAAPVQVRADPLRMGQAVLNVVANAVKYSSEGGLVIVTLDVAGQRARLGVADYGQGIDPEALPRIFEEFYQADLASARRGGLGLGLAIARYIVDEHAGSITADSAGVGRGATFTMELPVLA